MPWSRLEEVALSFNGGKDSTVIHSFQLSLLSFDWPELTNSGSFSKDICIAGFATFNSSWILSAHGQN